MFIDSMETSRYQCNSDCSHCASIDRKDYYKGNKRQKQQQQSSFDMEEAFVNMDKMLKKEKEPPIKSSSDRKPSTSNIVYPS